MRSLDQRTRLALRYMVLALLGGISGLLLSRLLSPVVFERDGLFMLVAFTILVLGVVLLVRVLWIGGRRS